MINAHKIRLEICDIGDRIYKKGFASANDGNLLAVHPISYDNVLITDYTKEDPIPRAESQPHA